MSDARKKAPKTHKRPTRADATPHAIQRAHRAGEHGRGAALVVAGKGPGVSLAPAAQRRLDAHLGHRFSALRIHTDDFAARTARALDANAFTVGRDVFFSAGRYTPDEPAGYARLAHEAAHTVQQRSSTATFAEGRLEAEADRAVLAGSTAGLSATSPMIQREPTWPRRTTGAAMLREAERILATARDPKSTDELTRLGRRSAPTSPRRRPPARSRGASGLTSSCATSPSPTRAAAWRAVTRATSTRRPTGGSTASTSSASSTLRSSSSRRRRPTPTPRSPPQRRRGSRSRTTSRRSATG